MAEDPAPSHHSSKYLYRHPEAKKPDAKAAPTPKTQLKKPTPKDLSKKSGVFLNVLKHILDFVEQPLTLTALAILAALVDLISHTPVLLFVGLLMLAGLHRTKKLEGRPVWRVQVPIYLLALVVTTITLYGIRIGLKKTSQEFVDKVVAEIAEKIKPAEVKQSQKTPDAKPVTLETLFKTDFPYTFKFAKPSDPIVFEDGTKVVITAQEYADFQAKSAFMGYYIPMTPFTFRVAVRIANSVKSSLQQAHKGVETQTYDPDDSPTSLDGLSFSGRVYLYHEYPLTLKQKSVLADYYESKKLDVEFRGTQYLWSSEMAKKLSQAQVEK